ncbi:glycosyltransferase family 2 protein [Lepidopterella palustris CBS 459.81]|uniref:Glycosyltransferase family 2 protein n=1 Tax=Lepidopterella palustris CBS 459.81 TaxID=1314670 RepID=A0A8E2E4K1_9PEZI|nr:glycosyltransferase family 2 protein [Lepidopterella palustris CBS 459.81]
MPATPQDGEKVGFFRRSYNKFRAAYAPLHDPPIILPVCPTDEEKYCYLRTNRIPLYVLGIFAFLSLSAGMWLFTVCAYIFAWFGLFVVLLQFYLMVSYFVGVVGKDYDYDSHKQVLQSHAVTPANAPTVDIFLPCCMEPLVILENTYKHVRALDYPTGKLQVHVMDDGNQASVKELAERYGFNYSVRDDRPRLKKAGNLRWHFARTSAEFFVIYDADFCPRPDFLHELIPEHLADPKTAIIQTPQFFRVSDDQTWVEQGAGATQELFYRVVQVNRNRWGASICVGSNAVYRRAALEEVGGTAEIGFSEDVHTGFGAVNRGWKLKYIPICLATGVCPDTPRSFFSQQMRWCMGSTTLLSNPAFWKSDLSFIQKICYMCGMMYYSAVALSIFISPIPGILLLWFRPIYFKYYNLSFAVPSILYGLLLFYFWAKAKYGLNVQHIMVIQSYAYLTAIKDKIFGRALMWVPTGDAKAHKSNKYRNMRVLCWCWTLLILGGLVSAVIYRVGFRGMEWYNTLPLIILNVYNLYLAHPFLFYMG